MSLAVAVANQIATDYTQIDELTFEALRHAVLQRGDCRTPVMALFQIWVEPARGAGQARSRDRGRVGGLQ